MAIHRSETNIPRGPAPERESKKKYRDRPADEGKHGDAADEPNAGVPSLPHDTPGRPKATGSRQQHHIGQVSQTGSPALDSDLSNES